MFRTEPFPLPILEGTVLKPGEFTVAEIHGPTLPRLVSSYVADSCEPVSLALAAKVGPRGADASKSRTEVSLGVGLHTFEWGSVRLWALQQAVGPPVGTAGCAAEYQQLLLLAQGIGKGAFLREFCDTLIRESEQGVSGSFTMFSWDTHTQCWNLQGSRPARALTSVVLPQGRKEKLLEDVAEFLSPATRRFYISHGIPYRRSYLFHGVPGTGKTSLIQALAGAHERNLCVIQPTDRCFTDDMLKSALSNAPARSIIVMEDVDALFTRSRENRAASAMTFAGLLNALDGVGTPEGQIFVLTTNFREQLDDALLRDGRVDYQVRFEHADENVICSMFSQFFPSATEADVVQFHSTLQEILGSGAEALTPAILQHFFVARRKLGPQELIAAAAGIVEELRERTSDSDPTDPATPTESTHIVLPHAQPPSTPPRKEHDGAWCTFSTACCIATVAALLIRGTQ